MPSNPAAREIYYHPNAAVYQVVHGIERRTLTPVAGATVDQQRAALINQGAIDRTPGQPGELLGNDAVRFLEALKNI